jgi:hypothetical protein
MKQLSYEDAVLLLKEIVADRGDDYVYPSFDECAECSTLRMEDYCDWHTNEGCRYFTETGAPACIVGEFFHRTLQPEEYNRFYLEGRTATEAISLLPLEVDARTKSLLTVAQQRQDVGHTWGDALSTAIDAANTFTE